MRPLGWLAGLNLDDELPAFGQAHEGRLVVNPRRADERTGLASCEGRALIGAYGQLIA